MPVNDLLDRRLHCQNQKMQRVINVHICLWGNERPLGDTAKHIRMYLWKVSVVWRDEYNTMLGEHFAHQRAPAFVPDYPSAPRQKHNHRLVLGFNDMFHVQ